MEEMFLTDGQFQRLLNSTDQPDRYNPEISSLVAALHKAKRVQGNKWKVHLAKEDVEVALGLFETRVREYGAPGDTTAYRFFINDSPTARRLLDERKAQGDVPRETSQPS